MLAICWDICKAIVHPTNIINAFNLYKNMNRTLIENEHKLVESLFYLLGGNVSLDEMTVEEALEIAIYQTYYMVKIPFEDLKTNTQHTLIKMWRKYGYSEEQIERQKNPNS